ncbi:MAG: hypothetical protein RBS46_02380 [Methyloversatilis sp.]|jgi:hypothetical protein|nr:hypothetical protein [Methyloversatilis sp.]
MSDGGNNSIEPIADDESAQVPQAELQSAIEKLSRDKPESFTEIFSMMGVGPMANPLHQKMTESHITQVLDLASKHDEREFQLLTQNQTNEARDNTSSRRYLFAVFAVVSIIIVIVLFLFKDKPDVLIPLLTGLGGLVGGFAGGFGLAKSK